MLTPRLSLARRVTAALDAAPSRIPVLLGGCGSGRTTVLQQLRERLGRGAAQYIDIDRTATTPERFLRALTAVSPFPVADTSSPGPASARAAFEATLAFFTRSRSAASEPATFLLDEFLELRTFESFPGLRRVQYEFLDGLAASGNRFVLTSRYAARALRLLRDRSARFEVIHMPVLTAEDTLDILGPIAHGEPEVAGRVSTLRDPQGRPEPNRGATIPGRSDAAEAHADAQDADFLARTVNALADGRPAYVRCLADELAMMREHGGPGSGDAIGALAALLAPDGRLSRQCGYCYELRLHRARGYGALKAILEILGEDEGLTLTEISLRLQRTPGSTKDYLSWLEDVDLVTSRQKRYSFTDPLLRVWVRLHCRPSGPTEDDLAREVHRYALPRLPASEPPKSEPPKSAPQAEPAFAMAGGPPSGIIEID